jgi:hypothetical protein
MGTKGTAESRTLTLDGGAGNNNDYSRREPTELQCGRHGDLMADRRVCAEAHFRAEHVVVIVQHPRRGVFVAGFTASPDLL